MAHNLEIKFDSQVVAPTRRLIVIGGRITGVRACTRDWEGFMMSIGAWEPLARVAWNETYGLKYSVVKRQLQS